MSWAHEKPTIFSDEDELQLKLEFARLCAEDPSNVSLHGYTLFPGEANYGRAMAAQKWIDDPVVQREISRLRKTDAEVADLLPGELLYAKEALDRSRSEIDAKVRFDYFKLAGEALGYINKGKDANINVNVVQNVIEVPTRATEEELPMLEGQWAEQQRRLIADARASRPN